MIDVGKSEGKKIKFRSNLMGGFNKTDVITYIAKQNKDQLAEMESLRASLATSENACAAAEETLDTVTGELAEANDRLEELRTEADGLRAELADAQKKIQESADAAASAQDRADEAEKALAAAKQAAEQAESRLAATADKSGELNSALEALEKANIELDDLRKTGEDQARRIESLESEKADADERLQMLMSGLRNVAGEYDFSIGGAPVEDPRIAELTQRVEELTAENDQLKSSLEKVNGFRSAIRSMLNKTGGDHR